MAASPASSYVARVSIPTRFMVGSVAPAAFLSLCTAVIVMNGKGEAPMIVMFASLFAVPAVMLLNCWVLFVDWQRRYRLVVCAAVSPAIVIIGSMLFVHGTGHWRDAGLVILLPFFEIVQMQSLGALTALWAAAMAGLLFTAWRITSRSRRGV